MGKVTVLLISLGCFILLVSSASAFGWEDEEKFEEWVHKLRPAMIPVMEKRAKHARQKIDSTKYFDRNLSLFDVIRMFMKDHGKDVNKDIEDLLSKEYPGSIDVTCPDKPQCPPTGTNKRGYNIDLWRDFTKAIENDSPACEPCQLLIESLQETGCGQPWEEMRDNLINLCEGLLFPLLDVDPVMCNGSISLQGEHLYCILLEASSFEVCESFNLCYPETPINTVPVKERTPWALKDKLQPKLQRKLVRKERKRRHKKQVDTVTVVQLSDIHMQMKYTIGAPTDCKAAICCLEDSLPRDGTEYARAWGEYTCNLPERTMRKFLARVNDFSPEFVVYAGDSPPHTLWDETIASQLNCSNIVVNAMRDSFTPGLRVYPTIGNHEMYPTNLYSKRMSETAAMNEGFTRMWHDLAGLDPVANGTFTDMSYYTVLHQPGLRIMSVNSNFDWYTNNFYNTLNKNDTANEQHKSFVETTLANARTAGEKVIIISHHPIGGAVIRTSRWWQQVAVEYGDVIALHVSGHTHSDIMDLIIDPDTDEAAAINLVSPTATSSTNINPSMRVFELDATTFELVDYQCYYFQINEQNPEEDPIIELNYDARTEYNMTSLSPLAWQDLTLRFIDDEVLFQTWYANRNAMVERGPCLFDNVCGESCKVSSICSMWFAADDEVSECEDTWNVTLVAKPILEGRDVKPLGAGVGTVVGSLLMSVMSLVITKLI